MSGTELGMILDDPHLAGVFFVLDEDLSLMEEEAGDAGLRVCRFDLSGCLGKEAMLDRMAAGLQTPPGLGRNWDALSDQLRDLGWLGGEGYALLISNAIALRDADESVFDTLLEVLEDAVTEWQSRAVPFWVFVALPKTEFPEA